MWLFGIAMRGRLLLLALVGFGLSHPLIADVETNCTPHGGCAVCTQIENNVATHYLVCPYTNDAKRSLLLMCDEEGGRATIFYDDEMPGTKRHTIRYIQLRRTQHYRTVVVKGVYGIHQRQCYRATLLGGNGTNLVCSI